MAKRKLYAYPDDFHVHGHVLRTGTGIRQAPSVCCGIKPPIPTCRSARYPGDFHTHMQSSHERARAKNEVTSHFCSCVCFNRAVNDTFKKVKRVILVCRVSQQRVTGPYCILLRLMVPSHFTAYKW